MTDNKVLLTRPVFNGDMVTVLLRPGYMFPYGNIMAITTPRTNVEEYVRFAVPVPLSDYTRPIAQVIAEFDLGADSEPDAVRIAADRLEDIGGDSWVVSQWRRGHLTY